MRNYYYPIAVKLRDKIAVVVGGGAVAERKIKTLLKAGAKVRVISPALTPWLERARRARRISCFSKKVEAVDLYPADIIIAATSDSKVNEKVSFWAGRRRVLVNVVDRAKISDFISPALLHVRQATVAVYTQGKDPVLSRDLKNFLKEYWDVFLSYRNRL